MSNLERDLWQLITQWQRAAEGARLEAVKIDNLLARGHLLGTSVGLEFAADQIRILIGQQKPVAPAPDESS